MTIPIPEFDIPSSCVPDRMKGGTEDKVVVECIDSGTGAVIARARVAGLAERFRVHVGRVWEWSSGTSLPDEESLRRGLMLDDR